MRIFVLNPEPSAATGCGGLDSWCRAGFPVSESSHGVGELPVVFFLLHNAAAANGGQRTAQRQVRFGYDYLNAARPQPLRECAQLLGRGDVNARNRARI